MRLVLASCLFFAAAAGPAAAQAVNANLLQLHDDLHLSANQEAAWRDYTLAVQPTPEMQARHKAAQELLPLVPTPRRIALLQANMEQDQADFRRQGAAVIAFYDQLTPAQQRTFDLETAPGSSPSGPAPRTPSRPREVTPPPTP